MNRSRLVGQGPLPMSGTFGDVHWSQRVEQRPCQRQPSSLKRSRIGRYGASTNSKRIIGYSVCASPGSPGGPRDEERVEFPKDYVEVIRQAQAATQAALADGKQLLEVEFPVSSLSSVQGDEEGANEMTISSQFLRKYTRMFLESAATTRIFFPDKKEMELQSSDIWNQTKCNLDYLTKPNGLLDIGVDISGYDPLCHVTEDDRVFIAAYPSFDPRELVAADKVWSFVQMDSKKSLIFFNAELDRLRSNYYPGLVYPQMARLRKDMMPLVTPVYYIHNFKGSGGGVLFRSYPGPWQVLLRLSKDDVVVVHTQEEQPTLKEVALQILPKAASEYRRQ